MVKLHRNTDPDAKRRLVGAKSQVANFDLLFGHLPCGRMLKILSRTIQNESIASEAQSIAQ